MRCSSIHTRILISNAFLLPLFSYLIRFVLLPYRQVVLNVKELLRKAIIHFNGGGVGYTRLITPRTGGFALNTSLRDLVLERLYDGSLLPTRGQPQPATTSMGDMHWVSHWSKGLDRSVNTEDHAAYCAFIFLHDSAPRRNNYSIDLDGLPPITNGPVRRNWIYEILTTNGYDYKRERHDAKYPTSLPVKVGKAMGTPPSEAAADFLKANSRLVINRLNPTVWNTQVRLTMNEGATWPGARQLPLLRPKCGLVRPRLRPMHGGPEGKTAAGDAHPVSPGG